MARAKNTPTADTEQLAASAAEAPAAAELKPAAFPADILARVLCAVTINGATYHPNTVVRGLSSAEAEAYAADIDTSPEAVAYALAEGTQPVDHIPAT